MTQGQPRTIIFVLKFIRFSDPRQTPKEKLHILVNYTNSFYNFLDIIAFIDAK